MFGISLRKRQITTDDVLRNAIATEVVYADCNAAHWGMIYESSIDSFGVIWFVVVGTQGRALISEAQIIEVGDAWACEIVANPFGAGYLLATSKTATSAVTEIAAR